MGDRYTNEVSRGRGTWAQHGRDVGGQVIARLIRVDGVEEWRPATVVRGALDAVMVRIEVPEWGPDPYYCWLRPDDVATVVSPSLGAG